MKDHIGKTVFTVRADTNTIDSWTLDSILTLPDGDRAILKAPDGRTCILPMRCVFKTRDEALEVANKNFYN
jgi:hypothetical protein